MRKNRRSLCVMLLVMALCIFEPTISVQARDVNFTEKIAWLRTKFPHDKYWNHVGANNYNNPNGYTSTPCTHHTIASSWNCPLGVNLCDCNYYNGIQCC